MNAPLDLDALRGRWRALDHDLDDALALDVAAVRRTLEGKARSAFRGHLARLWLALALDALALGALGAFVVAHLHDLPYLLLAVVLVLAVLLEMLTDAIECRAIARLDLAAPVADVDARLAALRARRLRTTATILVLSVALWAPFVLVVFKGLFGADLYRALDPSVLLVTLAIGLAFIAPAVWIGRAVSRRFRGHAGYEQFLDGNAGMTWSRANARWHAYVDFEERLAHDPEAVRRGRDARDAAGVRSRLPAWRALRRTQVFGIVGMVAAMLPIVAFNAQSGGQPVLLVAGLSLHFACLASMVACIVHLNALARLDHALDDARIAATLAWMASQRARLGRVLLAMSPWLATAATVVVANASGTLATATVTSWALPLAAVVAVASAALGVVLMCRPHAATRVVDALCFGTLRRTNVLVDTLDPSPPTPR